MSWNWVGRLFTILAFVVIIGPFTDVRAEEGLDLPDFSRIRTPESPAFVLLGLSPSSVERPTTPRAFAVSLVSNFTEGTSAVIPKNFALDAAPFWMFHQPDLTYESIRGYSSGILRNLTVSLATSTPDADGDAEEANESTPDTAEDATATSLALGVRSSLVSFIADKPPACVHKITMKLETLAAAANAAAAEAGPRGARLRRAREAMLAAVLMLDGELGDPVRLRSDLAVGEERLGFVLSAAKLGSGASVAELEILLERYRSTRAAIDQALAGMNPQDINAARDAAKEVNLRLDAQIKEADAQVDEKVKAAYLKSTARLDEGEAKACREAAMSRSGFNLDWATALALKFPDQKFNDGEVSGAAGWLTAGYVGAPAAGESNWSAFFLSRYGAASLHTDEESQNLDFGVRATVAWSRYAASLEGIYRRVVDGPDDEDENKLRTVAALDARLVDDLWITASFGRDFTAKDADSLVALANLSWQLGDDSVIPIPKSWEDSLK